MDVTVRRFTHKDALKVCELIRRNFMEVNIRDYSKEAMEQLSAIFDMDKVIQVARVGHMYVVVDQDEAVIGCGAITSYMNSDIESMLVSVFVMPELQASGIGSLIIHCLEEDDYYKRAQRVEVHSSITACTFYLKLGYAYKNGVKALENNDIYRLEKFN